MRNLTQEMAFQQNKNNQTAFVIVGEICKIEVNDKVSFRVNSKIPTPDIFGGVRILEKCISSFYEFPKSISHKIIQNINRRVKITIELTDDEDFI
jgi:hypothetical protein